MKPLKHQDNALNLLEVKTMLISNALKRHGSVCQSCLQGILFLMTVKSEPICRLSRGGEGEGEGEGKGKVQYSHSLVLSYQQHQPLVFSLSAFWSKLDEMKPVNFSSVASWPRKKKFFHEFTTQKKIWLLREDLKLRSFDLPSCWSKALSEVQR